MTQSFRNCTWLLLLLAGLQNVAAEHLFNVRDHGAKGDGTTNDQRAIQSAIDACAHAAGGTVVFPRGDFLSGTLRLATGVTLHLEAGATLWASTNRNDYPDGESHLLVAAKARRVRINGSGVINGQGTSDYGGRWGVPDKPAFRTGILLFTDCAAVSVSNVTILNSDAWTLHFKRCDGVTIEDMSIRNNYRRLNSDGIDPNMCRNVRITRCRISSGDDCIVLKTTEQRPCENVLVTDCELESAASALKLGTESQGDFRNIRLVNCVISNSLTGVGFYLKDGGTMENVVISNIVIKSSVVPNRVVTPVFMDIERRHADSRAGRIRDVTFERLDITSGSGVLVQGMPERPIERLTFRNVNFRVPHADDYAERKKPVGGRRTTSDERDTLFARETSYFTVAHVRELMVENLDVTISPAAFRQFDRSAFCGRHLDGVKLVNIGRSPEPQTDGRRIIDLRDCQRVDLVNR